MEQGESLGAKSKGEESLQDEGSKKSQEMGNKRGTKQLREGEQRVPEEQSSKKSSEEVSKSHYGTSNKL